MANIKYTSILADDGVTVIGYEFSVPYVSKMNGHDPDYLKVSITNDGMYVHNVEYNEKCKCNIVSSSGGAAQVDDSHMLQLNIEIDGVLQPFLIPALEEHNPDFIKNMQTLQKFGDQCFVGGVENIDLTSVEADHPPIVAVAPDALPKNRPLTKEDAEIYKQIQKFPNKPLIWQKKAEAEGEKDINYIFIPIETTKELTFLRVMQKDGKAYINMNGEDGKPTTYELVDAQISGDTVTISYMREGKVYEKALPTEAVADPTRNGLLVDTLQKVIRNEEITFGEDQRIKEENGCPRVKNFPQKGAVEKSGSLYPKGQILTLEQGGIKYHHIPYATVEGGNLNKDNYLLLMEKDGQHYMNLPGLDPTDPTKKTTCLVESATYNADGKLEITAVYGGERHKVELPVEKSVTGIVPGTTPPTTATVDNTHIDAAIGQINHTSTMTTTTVDDSHCPRPVNPAPTKDEIVPRTPGVTIFGDKLSKRNNTAADVLDPSFNWKGTTFEGKGMPIWMDVKKVGSKSVPTHVQTISVFKSDNVLMAVTEGDDKKPVSVFTQESPDKPVQWHVSKDFLDKFKSENPGVDFGSSYTEVDGYYVFEVDKLKLSPNMDLEDLQIKGASSDIAFMFSARGFQARDKGAHAGQMKSAKPLNIAMSDGYLNQFTYNPTTNRFEAKNPSSGLSFDIPLFKEEVKNGKIVVSKNVLDKKASNIFLMELRNERERGGHAPDEVIPIQLPPNPPASPAGPLLASLPVKQPDGSYKYLDALSMNGQMYIYSHPTGENSTGHKEPGFFLVREFGLESSSSPDTHIRIGLESNLTNNTVRIGIGTVDHGDVDTIKWLHEHGTTFNRKPGQKYTEIEDRGKNKVKVPVFAQRADAVASVLDEKISVFERKYDDHDTDPDPVGTVPTLPDPTYRDIETHDEDIKDPEYKPPKKELPKRKDKVKKEKLWNGLKNKRLWIGLFALCVILSCLVPFFAILANIIGGLLIANEIQPLKDITVEMRDYRDRRKVKHKSKVLERQIAKNKENIAVAQKQKADLQAKIKAIQEDSKMSATEKARKIAELNGKIARLDSHIANLQADTRQCRIQIERNENPRYQKCMERKKWLAKEKETAHLNINHYMGDNTRRRNENTEINGHLPAIEGYALNPTSIPDKNDPLRKNPRYKQAFDRQEQFNRLEALSASGRTLSKKEQEEVNQYNDFKTLMGKPESALTPDEKARLERLKGKFGDSLSPLGSLISALRGLVSDNTSAISSNDAEIASWERYDHDLDDYGDRLETVEAQLDQEIEDAVTRYEEINSDVIDQGLEVYTYEDIPDELTPEEQAERDAEIQTRNNAQENVFGSRPGGRPVDRSGGRGR
ncbi:MAG: hypothetical protein IJX00_02360 [Clostridia bacterium]|nr:hypothetical protein [Clostridia bacterium]